MSLLRLGTKISLALSSPSRQVHQGSQLAGLHGYRPSALWRDKSCITCHRELLSMTVHKPRISREAVSSVTFRVRSSDCSALSRRQPQNRSADSDRNRATPATAAGLLP